MTYQMKSEIKIARIGTCTFFTVPIEAITRFNLNGKTYFLIIKNISKDIQEHVPNAPSAR